LKVDLSNPQLWQKKYLPAITSPKTYNILFGGAGSGKSQQMIQLFLAEIMNPANQNQTFFVIRKVSSTLRNSVIQDFKNKITDWELGHLIKIKISLFEITCGTNRIVFMGCDDPEKLKSLSQAKYIWIEEATELSLEDFTQVTLRLRGKSAHQKRFFLTFNPVSDTHWIKKRFFDKPPENEKDSILILHANYLDNLSKLDKEYSNRMLAIRDLNETMYQIYALGDWGVWDRESLFATDFNEQIHVVPGRVKATKKLPLFLSFDFNASKYGSNTNTCMVAQMQKFDSVGQYWAEANIIKTYRIADLETLCKTILEEFPGCEYHVNGDASGSSANPLTENNISSYQLIVSYLGISPEFQLHVPNGNLRHISSRLHTNLAFKKCQIRIFDGQGDIENHNSELIADLKSAKMTKGSLDTWKKENPLMGHCLDTFRYFISANFYEMAADYNLSQFNEKLERMAS
jgi:hypothetical protein